MAFPLSFSDFSIWIGITTIILLMTSELLSPYYGRVGIMVDRHRLRMVAIALALLFFGTVAYRIYEIVAKP